MAGGGFFQGGGGNTGTNGNPVTGPVGTPAPAQQINQSTNPNIFQTANAAQNAAMGVTGVGMGYDPGSLLNAPIDAYQNPYTDQVVNTGLNDIERSRQMAINDTGAAATAAGAFGGSRHGVAESLTNDNYARQASQFAAGQRQAGFNNAQQGAMFDINNRMAANQARMNAAGQLAGMANQAFGMGRQVNQDQISQGLMQQALQQQLIDAGRQQYMGYANSPQTALNLPLSVISAASGNMGSTSTQSYQPGLLNYLSLGAGLLGGI